jgi:hypothetical protein
MIRRAWDWIYDRPSRLEVSVLLGVLLVVITLVVIVT